MALSFSTPMQLDTGDADRGFSGNTGLSWDAYFAALRRGENPPLPTLPVTPQDVDSAGVGGWNAIMANLPRRQLQIQQALEAEEPGSKLAAPLEEELGRITTIMARASEQAAKVDPQIKQGLVPVLQLDGTPLAGYFFNPNNPDGPIVRTTPSADQLEATNRTLVQLQSAREGRAVTTRGQDITAQTAAANRASNEYRTQLTTNQQKYATDVRLITANLAAKTAEDKAALEADRIAVSKGQLELGWAQERGKQRKTEIDNANANLREALGNLTNLQLAEFKQWGEGEKLDEDAWKQVSTVVDNENTRRSLEERGAYTGLVGQRNTDVESATKLAEAAKDIYVKQIETMVTAPGEWFQALVAGAKAIAAGRGLPNNFMQGVRQPTPPEDPVAFMLRARDALISPEERARITFQPGPRLAQPEPWTRGTPPDMSAAYGWNLDAAGIGLPQAPGTERTTTEDTSVLEGLPPTEVTPSVADRVGGLGLPLPPGAIDPTTGLPLPPTQDQLSGGEEDQLWRLAQEGDGSTPADQTNPYQDTSTYNPQDYLNPFGAEPGAYPGIPGAQPIPNSPPYDPNNPVWPEPIPNAQPYDPNNPPQLDYMGGDGGGGGFDWTGYGEDTGGSMFATPPPGGDPSVEANFLQPVLESMPPEYLPRAAAAIAGIKFGGDADEELNYAFADTGYQVDWPDYEQQLQDQMNQYGQQDQWQQPDQYDQYQQPDVWQPPEDQWSQPDIWQPRQDVWQPRQDLYQEDWGSSYA